MTSFSATSRGGEPVERKFPLFNGGVWIALIAGVLTLLLAQQVATGWLALGEQINIPRSNFNLQEWVIIIGGAAWGLFSLRTAGQMMSKQEGAGVQAYFDGNIPMPAGLRYGVAALAVGAGGLIFIALQIATRWLALGERINIPRSNLSWFEYTTIVLCVVYAALLGRTILGFLRRERPAWSWGIWLAFFGIFIGFVLFLSGMFDIQTIVPDEGTILNNLAGLVYVLVPGWLIALPHMLLYRTLAPEYGDSGPKKAISGSLSERAKARDISSKRFAPGQSIRVRLAKSPGAGAIIGFVGLFIFFTIASDLFLQAPSLASALSNNVTRGIVVIGVTFLMISGEFDLSVGSLLGIGGLTFMGLMTGQFPPGIPPLDPIVAALLSLAFVSFLGLLNGLILVVTGIPSFIVTLASQLMLRGIPLVVIAGGITLRYADYYNTPPNIGISRIVLIIFCVVGLVALLYLAWSILRNAWRGLQEQLYGPRDEANDFRTLGLVGSIVNFAIMIVVFVALGFILAGALGNQFGALAAGDSLLVISAFDLANGRITSLPFIGDLPVNINLRLGVVWWMVLVIVFQFILTQTKYGNATFAVGGNSGAARAQGINVNRVKITNYVLVALLVGFAGILDASRLQSIDALRGTGLELDVIAATVIGGALLSGGYGSVIGALLGVFIFGMMQTGLVLIGVDARLFEAVIGAIILVAVVINNWSRSLRR
jgi:ribose/xylose/arabinose/galactoside ABC-type transport system permease subunit